MYGELGQALPRLQIYSKSFEKNQAFREVLSMLYEAILQIHTHMYRLFQRKGMEYPFP